MIDIKQFEGKIIAPRDDALLYDFIIAQNGIFEGCEITTLGANQLRVSSGRGLIMGRVFVVEEETILATLASSGTQQGRLLIRVDVSNAEQPISFATQAAAALPALVQEDINRDGTIYEMSLATYTVNEIQLSNLVLVDSRIGALLSTVMMAPNPFTIPAASWAASSELSGYGFAATITISGISAGDRVDVAIDKSSIVVAMNAGVLPGAFSSANALTFYSQLKPTSSVAGNYIAFKGA